MPPHLLLTCSLASLYACALVCALTVARFRSARAIARALGPLAHPNNERSKEEVLAPLRNREADHFARTPLFSIQAPPAAAGDRQAAGW